jgi:hypothetical protein
MSKKPIIGRSCIQKIEDAFTLVFNDQLLAGLQLGLGGQTVQRQQAVYRHLMLLGDGMDGVAAAHGIDAAGGFGGLGFGWRRRKSCLGDFQNLSHAQTGCRHFIQALDVLGGGSIAFGDIEERVSLPDHSHAGVSGQGK